MNGDGTFNAQILVDKLTKLNSSQQSIETLSHWCIFHRKNARQIVETWERQFHCSPKDQRVSFLYLANDILQNSRRKGMEFVGEFWRVLPDALNDVIENGDECGRKVALRLVDIWEERKVFNPRGQTLKDDLLGRNKNGKNISYKLKQPSGDMLEKITLSYQHVYNTCDEDALFGKCRTAISSVLKIEADMGTDFNLGNITGSSDELRVQHGILRECIEQLKAAESSRTILVSHLREALNEQELKIGNLRSQLQVAQVQYEQVGRLLLGQAPPPPPPLPDQNLDEIPPPPPASAYSEAPPPPDFPPWSASITIRDSVQPTFVNYTSQQQQGPASDITSSHITEENRTAASDVVTKLTSPASSAHMPSYVFPPLAPEGIGQSMSGDHSYDARKRPRLGNDSVVNVPCFLPQPQQPPPPPFPHPDSMHQPPPPLLPPTLLPIPLPLPPVAGPVSVPSFSYGSPPLQPMPSFPVVGVPPYPSPYQFQGLDGGFFSPPSYPAGPPSIPRQ